VVAASLQLDDSVSFSGSIAGFGVPGGTDLRDIGFANLTLGYVDSGGTSGTLTVQDGTHTAHLLMIGACTSTSFKPSDDGHGGTLIVDPPVADRYGLFMHS
jgi:hypothetical protein